MASELADCDPLHGRRMGRFRGRPHHLTIVYPFLKQAQMRATHRFSPHTWDMTSRRVPTRMGRGGHGRYTSWNNRESGVGSSWSEAPSQSAATGVAVCNWTAPTYPGNTLASTSVAEARCWRTWEAAMARSSTV